MLPCKRKVHWHKRGSRWQPNRPTVFYLVEAVFDQSFIDQLITVMIRCSTAAAPSSRAWPRATPTPSRAAPSAPSPRGTTAHSRRCRQCRFYDPPPQGLVERFFSVSCRFLLIFFFSLLVFAWSAQGCCLLFVVCCLLFVVCCVCVCVCVHVLLGAACPSGWLACAVLASRVCVRAC